MSILARSIALACIAVLTKPVLYVQSERMAELHGSAEERRGRMWGKPDLYEEGEQENHEQEERSTRRKFIAGVPVLNYHDVYVGASERTGVDMASLGEFEGEQKRWLVVLSPNTSAEDLDKFCNIPPGCFNFTESESPISGGLQFVLIIGTENDVNDMIDQADVEPLYIELDSLRSLIPDTTDGVSVDSDSVFTNTWNIKRIGATHPRSPNEGRGATVFVVDTGIMVTHDDFGGRAASGLDATKNWPRGLECKGDPDCAQDWHGHGTQCAGVAIGELAGVAPGANAMSIKVFGDGGTFLMSHYYLALDWLGGTKIRPAVGSLSLGGPIASELERTYINSAVKGGVTIVVAAGNENKDACTISPAYIESAITVGATNSEDRRSNFSNYGACVNIWAPGTWIKAASNWGDQWWEYVSGTSFACPHVAGVAALIQGLNKKATPAQVRDELTEIAEKNKLDDLKGGDVNVLLSARRMAISV